MAEGTSGHGSDCLVNTHEYDVLGTNTASVMLGTTYKLVPAGVYSGAPS